MQIAGMVPAQLCSAVCGVHALWMLDLIVGMLPAQLCSAVCRVLALWMLVLFIHLDFLNPRQQPNLLKWSRIFPWLWVFPWRAWVGAGRLQGGWGSRLCPGDQWEQEQTEALRGWLCVCSGPITKSEKIILKTHWNTVEPLNADTFGTSKKCPD